MHTKETGNQNNVGWTCSSKKLNTSVCDIALNSVCRCLVMVVVGGEGRVLVFSRYVLGSYDEGSDFLWEGSNVASGRGGMGLWYFEL